MKKKILFCVVGLTLVLTGCTLGNKEKKDDPVIKGLNSVIEFNGNTNSDVTKIKYKVINNSDKNYELKVTFEVTLKDGTIEKIDRELNCVVKVSKTYEYETEVNIKPETVKSVGYFTD